MRLQRAEGTPVMNTRINVRRLVLSELEIVAVQGSSISNVFLGAP